MWTILYSKKIERLNQLSFKNFHRAITSHWCVGMCDYSAKFQKNGSLAFIIFFSYNQTITRVLPCFSGHETPPSRYGRGSYAAQSCRDAAPLRTGGHRSRTETLAQCEASWVIGCVLCMCCAIFRVLDCLVEVAGWDNDAEHVLRAGLPFRLQGHDRKGVVVPFAYWQGAAREMEAGHTAAGRWRF